MSTYRYLKNSIYGIFEQALIHDLDFREEKKFDKRLFVKSQKDHTLAISKLLYY